MSHEWLTKREAGKRLNATAKSIERWSQEGLPRKGTGRAARFPWPEIRVWLDDRIRAQAKAEAAPSDPDDLEQAKTRKTAAEALIAEIELAEKRRAVVPMAVCEQVGAEMADALRAVLINAPSTYALDLERAGVPPEAAEAILDKLSTDLTDALRSAVERVTVEVDDDIGD